MVRYTAGKYPHGGYEDNHAINMLLRQVKNFYSLISRSGHILHVKYAGLVFSRPQWLLLLGLLLCPMTTGAFVCTVNNIASVNFGAINALSSAKITTSMTFGYSCTASAKDMIAGATLCFNIGASAVSGQVSTRNMALSGSTQSNLSYQLYQDAGNTVIWGSQNQSGSSPLMVNLMNIANLIPMTGNVTVYAQLPVQQASAIPGSYQDNYSGATASMTINTGALLPPGTCGTVTGPSFPFTIAASIIKQCTVNTVGNINLGAVDSTAINVTAGTAFNVACSNGTPYSIGLIPSNGSTAGNGVMKSTGSNTDLISYQLSSTPGANGIPWGNVVTNVKTDIGTGLSTSYAVYAIVPTANYTPGDYADTVTINVTY